MLDGKTVTFQAVGKLLGMGPATLKSYPRVNALIEQRKSSIRFRGRRAGRSEEDMKREQTSVREEEFRYRVQEAIDICKANGQPITREGLSSMVGVSRVTLVRYPTVRELVNRAVDENWRQRKELRIQKREAELIKQVLEAIQQLQNEGKRVTIKDVGRKIDVSASILYDYPQVKTILERAITA